VIQRPLRALALVGLALAALGCSSKGSTIEPPASLQRIEVKARLERLWDASLAGEDEDGLLLGLAPATDGRRIYAAGRDGMVSAFDLATGDRVWRTEVPRLTIGSTAHLGLWNKLVTTATTISRQRLAAGPSLGGGLLVVGSSDGEVAGLDAEDGKLLWNVTVGGEVNSAPATDGRHVVVRLANGQLIALDGKTGEQKWFADQPAPSLSLRGSSRPLIGDGRVYAGFDNGKVAAYEIERGQLVWESPLAAPSGRSEIERLVDIDGPMRLSAGELFAVAYHGRAASLDPDTGRPLWQRDLSSSAGLTADGVAVYVTDADSQVWALDRVNGGPLWTQADLRARMLTAPAVVAGFVAVGDLAGYLHLLDHETGRIVGREQIGGGALTAQPLVIEDVLVVQSTGGRLAAYRVVPRDAERG
jgi:outer membrane protein assembly factor BamB